MVSALTRKLLRDLGKMRGQVIAIVLVVACGIASYVTMLSAYASLEQSAEQYFQDKRLGHLFGQVNRAPRALERQIRDIAGVAAVQTRIARDVTLDVPGLSEPAVGHLVSIPDHGRPILADLHLRKGRWVAPGHTDEAIVSEAFALANGLEPGDSVSAVIGGGYQRLRIVGIGLSPEHVYQISAGSVWPDDRRYGVLWMPRSALDVAFDMDGQFNDIAIAVVPGVDPSTVAPAVDRLLDPFGNLGVYGRELQMSYRFVSEELKQLQNSGTTMPIIFLGVAAFLLNVVVSRLIQAQREQIAALKALGYRNRTIGWHFFGMVAVILVGGTAVGTAMGASLGDALVTVYGDYFRFPNLAFTLQPDVVVEATALSLGAGALGTWRAVRRAVKLPPAEAMRPPAPARHTKGISGFLGLDRILSPAQRIVLRNLERHPVRSGMSVLGLALSVAIVIGGSFATDSLNYIMDVNFQRIQRQDLTIQFADALPDRAVRELAHYPGVTRVEPARDAPVRIWSGHHHYETAIQGLPRDSTLHRLLDSELVESPLPEHGLLLTAALGQKMDLHEGDTVLVEVLERQRRWKSVQVAGFIDEMFGMQAYMEIHAVNRLLGEGPVVTGARLTVTPDQRENLYRELKVLPNVAGASLRTAAYDLFNENSAKFQNATTAILVLFAIIVAGGVVYNSGRVILAERSRELASLRVLGFTRVEISKILLGELGTHVVLSLPLGCVIGYQLAAAALQNIDAELYRFPVVIEPTTYLTACSVVVIGAVVTALVVRRKLDRLDLVEVLKTRE